MDIETLNFCRRVIAITGILFSFALTLHAFLTHIFPVFHIKGKFNFYLSCVFVACGLLIGILDMYHSMGYSTR